MVRLYNHPILTQTAIAAQLDLSLLTIFGLFKRTIAEQIVQITENMSAGMLTDLKDCG